MSDDGSAPRAHPDGGRRLRSPVFAFGSSSRSSSNSPARRGPSQTSALVDWREDLRQVLRGGTLGNGRKRHRSAARESGSSSAQAAGLGNGDQMAVDMNSEWGAMVTELRQHQRLLALAGEQNAKLRAEVADLRRKAGSLWAIAESALSDMRTLLETAGCPLAGEEASGSQRPGHGHGRPLQPIPKSRPLQPIPKSMPRAPSATDRSIV